MGGWSAAAAQGVGGPATATDDSRALAPHVALAVSEAVLEPEVGADIEMRVRNNSTIVDAYRIDAVRAPKWLTITQPEIRLMPGENQSMAATRFCCASARCATPPSSRMPK